MPLAGGAGTARWPMKLSAAKILPTLASLLILAMGVAAMNDDVRHFFKRLMAGSAGSDIREVAGPVREAAVAVYYAVRNQSIEHAPMTLFVVAAAVLVFFMLRT